MEQNQDTNKNIRNNVDSNSILTKNKKFKKNQIAIISLFLALILITVFEVFVYSSHFQSRKVKNINFGTNNAIPNENKQAQNLEALKPLGETYPLYIKNVISRSFSNETNLKDVIRNDLLNYTYSPNWNEENVLSPSQKENLNSFKQDYKKISENSFLIEKLDKQNLLKYIEKELNYYSFYQKLDQAKKTEIKKQIFDQINNYPDDILEDLNKDTFETADLVKKELNNSLVFKSFDFSKQEAIIESVLNEYRKKTVEDIQMLGIKSGNIDNVDKNDRIDFFPVLGNAYLMSSIFGRKFDPSFLNLKKSPYSRDEKYVYNNNYKLAEDADLESFVVLNEQLAKDKNHVYRGRDVVKDIKDPSSFELISNNFAKDKYTQYSINNNFVFTKILNTDPETSELIMKVDEVKYFNDKYGMYYVRESGDNVQGRFDADPETFRLIGPYQNNGFVVHFFADKDNVYCFIPPHDSDKQHYSGTYEYLNPEGVYKIEGADPESFNVINNPFSLDPSNVSGLNVFAKDKNYVYFVNLIVEGANPKNYESLWGGYGKENDKFYFRQYLLKDIDTKSFEVMDCGYAKDKNHVYFGKDIIEGADLQSFTVEHCQAKDISNVYVNGFKK